VSRAKSIKAAEATKVIENARRDIDIAFMNGIAQICERMDLSVRDVLARSADQGKLPDLCAGPCRWPLHRHRSRLPIPLRAARDPGGARGINDTMAAWVGKRLHEERGGTLAEREGELGASANWTL
jgi:UDP-N-acetyl-D-galactosamine dehydrogenase